MVGAVAFDDAAKSRKVVDFVGGFAIGADEPKHFIFESQTAILRAMPTPAISPKNMRHIIAIHLQNEAGALTRVTGLFSNRGYNIESRIGVTVLVAPGPEVTMHTPTRPLARA